MFKTPLPYFFICFTSLLWIYIVGLYLFHGKLSNDSIFVERLSWSGKEGRVLVIGDVSGCFKELQQLIKSSSYNNDRDSLIFVGDMVGAGLLSSQVVQFALDHNARCVRGATEDRIVAWYLADEKNKPKLTDAQKSITQSLNEDQLNFLLDCDVDIELSEEKVRIIHSGLDPTKDVAKQSEELLRKLGEEKGKIKSKVSSWFDDWTGPQLIVFGSSDKETKTHIKFAKRNLIAIGIDSGVVSGNSLSAFTVPDMKILQVPAKKVYLEAIQ